MSNSVRNWLIVAIVFVAGLGSVLRLDSAEEAKKPAVQKWEYYVHEQSRTDIMELGREGWELVAAISQHEQNNYRVLYFKRPIE